MDVLFTPQSQWLWTAVLAAALFYPIRKLIWVMSVRREHRKTGQLPDDARQQALRRRASITAILLSAIFSVVYVDVLFRNLHPPQ
ncbi:MAG: hypothetical protein ACFCUO_02340 [Rhodospirillales bacterium]